LGGILVAISVVHFGGFKYEIADISGNYNSTVFADIVKDFVADEVKSLSIDETHFEIRILRSEGTVLRVETNEIEQMKYDIYLQNGNLIIKHKPIIANLGFLSGSWFNYEKGTLVVYLPAGFELEGDLTINSASASVKVEMADAALPIGGKIDIATASGSIIASNVIVGERIKINGVSGAIKLIDCKAGNISVENVSGSTIITNCSSGNGNMQLYNISGSICVERCIANGKIDTGTVSGKTTVLNSQFGSLECKSVSGSVEIEVLGGQYSFNLESLSGSKKNTEPSYPNGISVKIETTSGNIKIKANNDELSPLIPSKP
jgi:hypothetical protein